MKRGNKGLSKRLLLKFFRLNPDILDPAWEDRNPGHAERDYARILRWEFCRNLRVGAVEYRSRPRTTRKKKSSRASWPTTRAEREALKIVGRHHDIHRGHILPLYDQLAKYYRSLIPSALNSFSPF